MVKLLILTQPTMGNKLDVSAWEVSVLLFIKMTSGSDFSPET
jgi:hypothetical protein